VILARPYSKFLFTTKDTKFTKEFDKTKIFLKLFVFFFVFFVTFVVNI